LISKKNIYLLFLSICSILLAANSIEDIKIELNKSVGKKKTDLLNQLSFEYGFQKSDAALDYAFEALDFAQQQHYTKGQAQAYHLIGHYYRSIKDLEKALDSFLNAVELWAELDLKKELANDQSNVANIYIRTSEFNEALHYYQLALENSITVNDSIQIANTFNNLGSLSCRHGNYPEALDFFYKSSVIKDELFKQNPNSKNAERIVSTINNIGNVHLRLENYTKALESYQKVLQIIEEFPSERQQANALNNIAIVYEQTENYRKALIYFEQALTINQRRNDRKKIASIMNNLGIVYEKLGDLNLALHYYELGLEIKEEIGDKYGISNANKNVGSIYLIFHKYDFAKDYFEKSIDIAKEIGARDIVKDNYKFLANMFAEQKKYEKAYKYELMHITLKDSILTESTTLEIAELETKYNLDKNEKEKEILVKDNLIYKLNMEKANLAKFRSYMLATLLTLLAGFLLMRFLQKRKINLMLEHSQKDLELKVKERTSELAASNLELENEIIERQKVEEKITESLNEKEVLLREIHHRVKNNLQIISSILNLQMSDDLDEHALAMFNHTKDRVYTMSLIHEKLYIENNLARIDLRNYLSGLVSYLLGNYQVAASNIKTVLNIDEVFCNVHTAVPCGLIINEIVTNSIKYAFPSDREGIIFIEMSRDESGQITLIAGDDGVSFKQNSAEDKTESIGLKLIDLLGKQLQANIEMKTDVGVVYKFEFKELLR
jgi:two-component sensor histidine kinase/tetratricopeptide (TPR) repeat protein